MSRLAEGRLLQGVYQAATLTPRTPRNTLLVASTTYVLAVGSRCQATRQRCRCVRVCDWGEGDVGRWRVVVMGLCLRRIWTVLRQHEIPNSSQATALRQKQQIQGSEHGI